MARVILVVRPVSVTDPGLVVGVYGWMVFRSPARKLGSSIRKTGLDCWGQRSSRPSRSRISKGTPISGLSTLHLPELGAWILGSGATDTSQRHIGVGSGGRISLAAIGNKRTPVLDRVVWAVGAAAGF